MPIPSEAQFLEFLKQADSASEMDVRKDPDDYHEPDAEAIVFSDVAQEGSQDTKEGVTGRVLDQKSRSDAAERALVGAMLTTRDFETSSVQLKSTEKVSFPRTPTLLEDTIAKLGRR